MHPLWPGHQPAFLLFTSTNTVAAMQFLVLGPLEVLDKERPLSLGGPKQRAVLAHLIVRANQNVSAEMLIDELWGEEPPETARNTLHTYVSRLRGALRDDRIRTVSGGYVLRAKTDEIDATRFEAMLKRAKASLDSDPALAATSLAEALTLWRGSPFADLANEESLRGETMRLDELRLSAIEYRARAEIAIGGHSAVISELEGLTARHPLRERMWASLMLALYRSGRQAEALAAYEQARQVLADELGTDPSADLQQLHQQILRRDPALDLVAPSTEPRPSRGDLQPGTEFAGYRIERILGRGGMGVVYLAEHAGLHRRVALKLLAPQLADDAAFRDRFIRESQLAASLDHPNVVPIYEAGETDGRLFMAMRYVEGTDPGTLISTRGPLELDRAISIVAQVADALGAAHRKGLVHRDVKPGNILIAQTEGEGVEHVYLSDFGLTKRTASDSRITTTGQFVGTLDYAAPEQFEGRSLDAAADVYSLGCVLYECLIGAPPFHRENDAAVMHAHLVATPPAPTATRSDLPPAIDTVVARALAKRPRDRYPSASAFATALRAVPEGVAGAGGRRGGVWRKILVAVGALLASIAGTAAIVSLLDSNGDPPLTRIPVDHVGRIDPATDTIGSSLFVGSNPTDVAVDQDAAWITRLDAGTLTRLDLATDEAEPVSTGGHPAAIGIDEAGSVWVLNAFEGVVVRIDPRRMVVEETIDLPIGTRDLAVGVGAVWVTNANRGTLTRIDLVSGDVRPIELSGIGVPDGVAAGEGAIWVAGSEGILKADPETGDQLEAWPVRFRAGSVAAGDGAVWVTHLADDQVARIDPITGPTSYIPVGNGPIDVVVGGDAVWVTNSLDGSVSRIDPDTSEVTEIGVGSSPEGVAFGDGSVWVAVHDQ
jgi:YVTN family beta-propeller protein